MATYLRFGFGPSRASQIGRTQAQERAAARARAQRQRAHAIRVALRDARRPEVETQRPEAIAAREAELERLKAEWADADARTYQTVIIGCSIDPRKGGEFTIAAGRHPRLLKGGEFTIAAEGREHTALRITVEPDVAPTFLSLKDGDIVEVVMDREGTGLEAFHHLSRANGSAPPKRVGFSQGRWGVW